MYPLKHSRFFLCAEIVMCDIIFEIISYFYAGLNIILHNLYKVEIPCVRFLRLDAPEFNLAVSFNFPFMNSKNPPCLRPWAVLALKTANNNWAKTNTKQQSFVLDKYIISYI